MTANELMQPRFEVIAEYPSCIFKKGYILDLMPDILIELEKYPHLFRKLDWWEFRKIEDMPKKLILTHNQNCKIYTIVRWDMKRLCGIIKERKNIACFLNQFDSCNGYFPID